MNVSRLVINQRLLNHNTSITSSSGMAKGKSERGCFPRAAGFAFGGMTTPGGRITNYPITSLEMLSVLSNTQVVFAHLIGLWLSIWMLQRIYRAA